MSVFICEIICEFSFLRRHEYACAGYSQLVSKSSPDRRFLLTIIYLSDAPRKPIPHGMVDTPGVSDSSSSPILPTQPTSVNHESTMDITSALPYTRFDEPEAPDALSPPEKQVASPAQEPPPTSSTVQFLGINYVPDTQTKSQRLALDPTPWESAASPSPKEPTATTTGPSSGFPPKRCAPLYV